jgi:hypothetical protein
MPDPHVAPEPPLPPPHLAGHVHDVVVLEATHDLKATPEKAADCG